MRPLGCRSCRDCTLISIVAKRPSGPAHSKDYTTYILHDQSLGRFLLDPPATDVPRQVQLGPHSTMPEARVRPPVPTLILPPSDESATFQHVPSGPLRREWEPGCQPDEVYDRLLPGWRAGLRRYLVNRLRGEKEWMAEMQVKVRTPRRDTYFYWTAIFGSEFALLICVEASETRSRLTGSAYLFRRAFANILLLSQSCPGKKVSCDSRRKFVRRTDIQSAVYRQSWRLRLVLRQRPSLHSSAIQPARHPAM